MEDVITQADCLACKSCCKFAPGDEYFAPVFSAEERDAVALAYGIPHERFEPIDETGTTFRVRLVPFSGGSVCPFYDLATERCGVYPKRPKDCSLWPIMLVKTDDPNILDITIAERDACPSLMKAGETALRKYADAMIALVRSHEYRTHFAKYPALAWKKEAWMLKIGELDLSPGETA